MKLLRFAVQANLLLFTLNALNNLKKEANKAGVKTEVRRQVKKQFAVCCAVYRRLVCIYVDVGTA